MKKIIALIFAVVMMLTLTACDTGSEPNEYYQNVNQGIKLTSEGSYEEAVKIFDKAVEMDDTLPDAYNRRGIAYLRLGESEKGVADLKKAIELEPTAYYYIDLIEYFAENGELEEIKTLANAAPADEKTGAVLEIKETNDGFISTYIYDKGNVVVAYKNNKDNSFAMRYDYSYSGNDDDRRVTGTDIYNAENELLYYFTYEYDENGKISKRTEYNANDVAININEYYNDENHSFLILQQSFTDEGVKYHHSEYRSDGLCVKENNYLADGSIASYFVYNYDTDGNLVNESEYRANGKLKKVTERLDANTKKVSNYQEYNQDQPHDYIIYKYDDNGNEISRNRYFPDGSPYVETDYKAG